MLGKLWPIGARTETNGELWLGGCAVSELAKTFGTPLYLFDETTLRTRARTYQEALRRHYPASAQTAYASKAYLCLAIAQLVEEEGLDLDVVSGGELHVALHAGFPPERIHFHGNNKSPDELAQTLNAGIGRIVVDNFYELKTLAGTVATRADCPVSIWLRLSPGVEAHTHAHIQTGQVDTKFGFDIKSGDAERAVMIAMQAPGLSLVGLHAHIGSQIYEAEDLAVAAARLIEFAAQMRDRHGFVLQELSPGGGWGVPMTESDPPAPIEPYIAMLCDAVAMTCREAGLTLPHLVLEPGRSLVAPAAVAIYTVGARKEIPGVRTYISVDGGMADNIRPALYGAQYAALHIANSRLQDPVHEASHAAGIAQRETVTIAGKFCESGDILIRDIELPRLVPGDLLAIPMAGAYTLAMSSNYNLARRPAVVLVNQGEARLIQRREAFDDLLVRDLPLHRDAKRVKATFWKYQALGNDYIMLDPQAWPEPPTPQQIRRICDRHRGVGADGVLWGPIGRSAPFGVRLFNPDGEEFEKSGNGLRIFARYLWDRRLPYGPDFEIDTPGGQVTAHVLDAVGSRIAMDMGRLSFDSQEIGLAGSPRTVIEEAVEVDGRRVRITAVTIGNPHCVVFSDGQSSDVAGDFADPSAELAQRVGPKLERLPLYPNRTNVQFAQAIDLHTLRIEIWERGAGYTLASGTSSCAAAGAAIRTGRCASPVTVQMPGGTMLVEGDANWATRLTGTVDFVCSGELGSSLLRDS
jgi:diaminopimelate decarboxylase